MIQTRHLCIVIFLGVLAFTQELTHATTVWNGPMITFSNAIGADWTQPQNQDRMMPNVWITRSSTEGIFNAATESGFTRFFSPADTEWAFGNLSNYASLSYTNWEGWFGGSTSGGPVTTVGKPAVVHLISEDVYLSIDFTFWGIRNGSFAYTRSTPSVPEPGAGLTLLAGFGLLATYKRWSKRRPD